MNKQEFITELSNKLNEVGEISQWHSGYKKGLYDALVLTRKLEEPNEIVLSEPSAWKTIAKLYHPNEVYWGNVRDSYLESLDEQEKLYRVELIKGKYLIYNHKNNQLHNQELDAYVGDHEQSEFTEQEIKNIDERYLAFKVEVEAK